MEYKGLAAMTVATAQGDASSRFERLIEIGIALSAERNHNRLMERILLEAKGLCNADGGTLYLKSDDDRLRFEIMRTDSLGIAMGGTTGKEIPFPPLEMFDPKTGQPNHKNIASHAALTGDCIDIPDAYTADQFDFSGTKKFDEGTGYRSKSFLTVPLKNHDGDVIGVLQLLNAQDQQSGEVIPFSADIQPLIEALASQAAVALDNQQLIEAQRRLLDSFIELIASAIDAKSPYTGGHCQRVPELTKMLVGAACNANDGLYKEFDLTEDEWYELHISAWLHDCGKVTTPEYVVDKATKLETINNRLHEIRTRFEVVKRDVEIDYLKGVLDGGDEKTLAAERDARLAQLDDDFAFVAECNVGGEFMAPERIERLEKIAQIKWKRTLNDRIGLSHEEEKRINKTPAPKLPVEETLLADKPEHIIEREANDIVAKDNPYGFKLETPRDKYNLGEVYNMRVARGTLTAEERYKINDHMVQTIVMLEQLPFPKHLKRVPEYAGGHHETMIGTGYPKKLTKADMSIPARCMAIADIFEALTASDRPYKKPKTLSESIRIMSFMRNDQHIDADLFELFLRSGVHKQYGEKYLAPEQVDDVDIEVFLNTES
jgi:HD-GYP domain-containing protein (c-di-GMP phosphodiesterase class II)